jgi:hypothetical protein
MTCARCPRSMHSFKTRKWCFSFSSMDARSPLKRFERRWQPLVRQFWQGQSLPSQDQLLDTIQQNLNLWLAPTLIPVINATGVILHTNLGRAPLSHTALEAVHRVTGSYSTLEFQLERGVRGSRAVHAERC